MGFWGQKVSRLFPVGYAPWHCQASLGLDTGAVDTAGGEFMMGIKMKGHVLGILRT